MVDVKKTFYDEIGGKDIIAKVHKIFYDKIYADPWIGKFFHGIDQSVIESQQNDFMGQNFGGNVYYLGKLPVAAHKHMLITEELFQLRNKYLREALEEAGISEECIVKWLKIDSAFKGGIIKSKVEECEKRYNTDELLVFEKEDIYKKSGNF